MAISSLSNLGGSQALEQAGSFNDLGSLDNLRSKAQQDEKAALREVAKQFESIFMQMVLKGMRQANAAFESEMGNSNYTKFYRDMSDQQTSINMAQQGALGLADLMVEQLDPQSSKLTPASLLNRGNVPFSGGENAQGFSLDAQQNAGLELDDKPQSLAFALEEQREFMAPSRTNIRKAPMPVPEFSPENLAAKSQAQAPLMAAANPAPSFKSPEDFVAQLMPYAEKTAKALGLDPKAIVAQAALETGWGQKIIQNADGSSSFNLFNIKSSKDWQGADSKVSTLEFENGVAVKKMAAFRSYSNFQESFGDYEKFLSNSTRYEKTLSSGMDSAQFLQEIQKAGYATDPNYATKVISVLNKISSMLGN